MLLDKLTGSHLVNKFVAFYETRRFITAFTSVHQLSLSCAKAIQILPSEVQVGNNVTMTPVKGIH
jgi:hypothetical protein